MNKSSRITLLIVTLLFVGITVWRVVALVSQKNDPVGKIELSGPTEVAVGEFNEKDYVLKAYYADGTVKEVAFYSAFFEDASFLSLSEVGTHTLYFTFENCRGSFEITITEKD